MARRYEPQDAECSVEGCTGKPRGRNLCGKHYERWRTHGTTDDPPTRTLEERFWDRVSIGDPTACWEWTSSFVPHGYGTWSWREEGVVRGRPAHRQAYIFANGSISDDLTVDHLCNNRACCNPAHLEAVTLYENIRRAGDRRDLAHSEGRDCGGKVCQFCRRTLRGEDLGERTNEVIDGWVRYYAEHAA